MLSSEEKRKGRGSQRRRAKGGTNIGPPEGGGGGCACVAARRTTVRGICAWGEAAAGPLRGKARNRDGVFFGPRSQQEGGRGEERPQTA